MRKQQVGSLIKPRSGSTSIRRRQSRAWPVCPLGACFSFPAAAGGRPAKFRITLVQHAGTCRLRVAFFDFLKEQWRVSQPNIVNTSLMLALGALLSACGTTPPPDYGGKWRPVNNYSETPIEIPLATAYIFQASPMDGTLKTMLTRWAKDSNMSLDYRFGSDFTLYGAVSKIDTTSIQDATSQLTSAYAAQGVAVTVQGRKIIVAPAVSRPASASL
ncbi:MAG: hypothetical protein ACSLE1_06015 [Sphingobium sp.]